MGLLNVYSYGVTGVYERLRGEKLKKYVLGEGEKLELTFT